MTLKWKQPNKTETTNERKLSDLIGLSNGCKRAWLLVGYYGQANARVKKCHAWELSGNQPILRFDVMLQHEWSIEQYLLHIRVFFGGKTKSPCFDLFIHWLIKQITNTYWNHFSRSYENRSMYVVVIFLSQVIFTFFLCFNFISSITIPKKKRKTKIIWDKKKLTTTYMCI